MGNYVTAGVGNYVTRNPPHLGNFVIAHIGPYKDFGPEQEQQALKLFTQRVEDHRNEQRRRQQQLDQPADQATPSSQPPAA